MRSALFQRFIVALTLAVLLCGFQPLGAQEQAQPTETPEPESAEPAPEQAPAPPLPELEPIPEGRKRVALSSAWSATAVQAGQTITLGVVFDMQPGWHINTNTVPDPLIPTQVQVLEAPASLRISTAFPKAHKTLDVGFGPVPVYEGKTVVFLTLATDAATPVGDHPIPLRVTWQACNDTVCLRPVTTAIAPSLKVVPPGGKAEPINTELFKGLEAAGKQRLGFDLFSLYFEIDPTNLLLLLPIAALGGLLLNFTPCVLPLIPIKVLGFSQAASKRGKCFMLGAVMSLGVVAFWLGLGVAIASIKGFTSTNQLFQMPWFTVTVGVVIAAMAMGMCGLFNVRLPQVVYLFNPSQETVPGSFLFGVMAAILSTPCTAPFMGAAAAWSATQSAALTLATFTAIGVGMALPYLVLSAFPKLVEKMPRTGPASEILKQIMGLLMLAAAAYFLGTGLAGLMVVPPDPPTRLYWWAVAAFIALAGGWLINRTLQIKPAPSPARRAVFVLMGGTFIMLGAWLGLQFTDEGPIKWTYYTPQRLENARKEKHVVVMEFTAQWCLNCHALEQAVLYDPRVVQAMNHPKVSPFKVDLTGHNPAGNAKLLEAGRRTIPLLVIYDSRGNEVFKSDAYTVGQVVDAIDRAVRQ